MTKSITGTYKEDIWSDEFMEMMCFFVNARLEGYEAFIINDKSICVNVDKLINALSKHKLMAFNYPYHDKYEEGRTINLLFENNYNLTVEIM